MNEQLIVKNFGPIKDATVDFKRVTVFIGPTGGGKSTLAKLAAIYRDKKSFQHHNGPGAFESKVVYNEKGLINYFSNSTWVRYLSDTTLITYQAGEHDIRIKNGKLNRTKESLEELGKQLEIIKEKDPEFYNAEPKGVTNYLESDHKYAKLLKKQMEMILESFSNDFAPVSSHYIPSERMFVASMEYSWAGLMRDDIGLLKTTLDFANSFSTSRKNIAELKISFLDITYRHIDGRDFIKIPDREEPLMLLETASGIQSVTPLLVLLEHLSRNTKQAQSFIIEEPELNLYPTAQQGLLNWLVEKCTKGENDLTLTTHSPYILSHLNLLLYAYQVADKHPDRKEAVAAIVPEASWINPKEFACYQVENGGVQSLVDAELGLIDTNELDGLSGDAADAFDNLIRLSKGFAIK
ncbi:MAG: AAA family ATPase [Janthinobacterium lividum]